MLSFDEIRAVTRRTVAVRLIVVGGANGVGK